MSLNGALGFGAVGLQCLVLHSYMMHVVTKCERFYAY